MCLQPTNVWKMTVIKGRMLCTSCVDEGISRQMRVCIECETDPCTCTVAETKDLQGMTYDYYADQADRQRKRDRGE